MEVSNLRPCHRNLLPVGASYAVKIPNGRTHPVLEEERWLGMA